MAWPRGVDRRTLLALAPGDVVAVCAFVALGQHQHFGAPAWELPRRFLLVAGGFLLGWALVAPLLGAYARGVWALPWAVVVPLAAWLLADAVGVLLRATAVVPGAPSAQFYLVAAVFGGLLLGGWRALATLTLDGT